MNLSLTHATGSIQAGRTLLLHTNPSSSSLRRSWGEKWERPEGKGVRSESEGEIRRLTVGWVGCGGEGTEDRVVEVRRICALKDEGQRRKK